MCLQGDRFAHDVGMEDTMKKKFLSALLSLALCATMIPATSFADQAQSEALYQAEANGEWQVGSFDEALLGVYDGGTIKLLKDVARTECVDLACPVTITSADPNKPCKIIAATDQHGSLLNVDTGASTQRAVGGGVVLENVIVDGGSENGLTATRAAVVVNSGQLTLGEGAVVQNNTNESQAGDSQSGIGGGIYVDKGTLVINGGLVAGNRAKEGGGVFVADGTCVLRSGTIRANTAAIGGGVYVDNNSSAGSPVVLKLSGGSVVDNAAGNAADNYGGGVYCRSGCKVRLSGNPIIADNTSGEETCGGIYLDGNGSNADVIIEGALTGRAKVMLYAPLQKNDFVVAAPEDAYTITSADMSKMRYPSEEFGLKLNDAGNVILYKADFIIEATAHGNGSISPSGDMGVFRGDSVEFTIVPGEGSVVKDMTVNWQSVINDVTDSEQSGTAVKTYVLENIQNGAYVDVYFEEVPSGGGSDGEGGGDDGTDGDGADDGSGGNGGDGETDGADDSATPPSGSSDSDQPAPAAPNEGAASKDKAAGIAETGDALGIAAAAIAVIALVAAGVALLARRRGGRP